MKLRLLAILCLAVVLSGCQESPEVQAKVYLQRGKEEIAKGALPKAVTDLTQAMRLDPKLAEAYAWRCVARRKMDTVGAITDCEKALDLDPRLVLARLHRGALRRAKSEFEGAIADFTAAIEVEPTPELHLERGITHASLGQFDQAMADYTRAIEIKPDLAPAYYNRAVAKQSSGDAEGSKADFEKVLQLVPPGHRLRGQAEKRLRGEPTS